MRPGLLLTVTVAFVFFTTSGHASAHPSDSSTLTIDLLLSERGLERIDTAAQRASYADRPSIKRRQRIAVAVLKALDIPVASAAINPRRSELYHEVGLTIVLLTPYTNAEGNGVQLETERLQRIAVANKERLKLHVCSLDGVLPIVTASEPGRATTIRDPRPGCFEWLRGTRAAPVRVTARL